MSKNETAGAANAVHQSERAAFEAWSKRAAPAYGFETDERGQYVEYPVHAGWAAWQARAAMDRPAAADAGGLPPLPTFMRTHIERAINEAERPRGAGIHDGMARLNVGYLKRIYGLAMLWRK